MLRVLSGVTRPRSSSRVVPWCTKSACAVPREHIYRQSSATMASAPTTTVVAVVSPPDNPALAAMPSVEGVEFIIGDDLATFQASPRLKESSAVMFLPPASPALLPELWPHIPNVKWFHSFFAGVDSLTTFFPTLVEAGVPLSNGRGAFSVSSVPMEQESLAEYAMAAALHFNKQIPRCQQNRKEKKWVKFVMDTLDGKTIGFLGFGHIAQRTAAVAKTAFKMKVAAVRRDPTKEDGGLCDIPLANKKELFAQSDFVVCVLPGTPQTLDYCGADEFAAMKPTGVFISMGRGVCVDEDALAAALQAGQIKGAALDVFKVEPLPDSSPLWDCENLLLTAHNADYTDDYFELGWQVWASNFERFSASKPLSTPVDMSSGY